MSTELSTSTKLFISLLSAYLAEQLSGVEVGEFEEFITRFATESKLAVPVPNIAPAKAAKAKADKPAAEKKPRRSSAAKEADEIFKQHAGKVVIIATDSKPTFVAYNGAADSSIGKKIKAAITGKGISEKENKDYGLGLSIPAKNVDEVMDKVCEILGENSIDFEHHTHVKATKPQTAYNIFQQKTTAELKAAGKPSDFAAVAALWALSDEKKASDAAAEAKKAEKKAESDRKKAEKEAAKAAKATAAKK
jgi:hypothetical protein